MSGPRWLLLTLTLAPAALPLFGPGAEPPPKSAVAACRFTWTSKTATLGEVVRQLEKQTKIPIDLGRASPEQACPVACRDVVFWQALEQIAAASRHQIAFARQGASIGLVPRPADAFPTPAASIDGPFRVSARRVSARLDLDTGRAGTDVALDVNWEPTFRAYLIEVHPTLTEVTDDRGRAVEVAAPAKGRTAVVGASAALTVRLPAVPRPAAKLKTLAGRFAVVGADRLLEVTFEQLPESAARPLTKQEGGVEVRLSRPSPRGNGIWGVEVRLTYREGLPEFESFESWLPENRAYLQKRGEPSKRYAAAERELDLQRGNQARGYYRFRVPIADEKALKDWQFVYVTPARIVEVPVTFRLTDVPLP